jgi:homeobox protein ESX1
MSKPADSSKAAPDTDPKRSPAPETLPAAKRPAQQDEKGGPAWPEPTRYGDWERGGKVSDF